MSISKMREFFSCRVRYAPKQTLVYVLIFLFGLFSVTKVAAAPPTGTDQEWTLELPGSGSGTISIELENSLLAVCPDAVVTAGLNAEGTEMALELTSSYFIPDYVSGEIALIQVDRPGSEPDSAWMLVAGGGTVIVVQIEE